MPTRDEVILVNKCTLNFYGSQTIMVYKLMRLVIMLVHV